MVQMTTFKGKKICGLLQDHLTYNKDGLPGYMGVIHPEPYSRHCPGGTVMCHDPKIPRMADDWKNKVCIKNTNLLPL